MKTKFALRKTAFARGAGRLSSLLLVAACLLQGPALADDPASHNDRRDRSDRVRITFFPNIGPTRVGSDDGTALIRSPSYDQYAANAIQAMLKGRRHMGGRISETPTAFQTLRRNRVTPGELIATEFNTWRGDLAPTGAFAAETGTFWRLGVRLESRTTFTLADARKIYDDPIEGDEFTLAESIGSFAKNRAVGINWGANGRPGGGDDIVYDNATADPGTTPLNVFVWLGNGKFDFITVEGLQEYYGGDVEAFFADWTEFVTGQSPFPPFFDAPLYFGYNYEVGPVGNLRGQASYTVYVCPAYERKNRAQGDHDGKIQAAQESDDRTRYARPSRCAPQRNN